MTVEDTSAIELMRLELKKATERAAARFEDKVSDFHRMIFESCAETKGQRFKLPLVDSEDPFDIEIDIKGNSKAGDQIRQIIAELSQNFEGWDRTVKLYRAAERFGRRAQKSASDRSKKMSSVPRLNAKMQA